MPGAGEKGQPTGPLFVGRRAELKQFERILQSGDGCAIIVVGQQGMGKTLLVNRMAAQAEAHPNLKCGYVRYEVTPTDPVDSTLALMMDHAYQAAAVKQKSLDPTAGRSEQWRALLNVINLGDLVMSLKRDETKNTRHQFIERLELISDRMPQNARAIFVIDPEKYMQKESDQAWAIVIRSLPPKIVLAFAQRPEDVLAQSSVIRQCPNAYRIPGHDLDSLDSASVSELIEVRSRDLGRELAELERAVARYRGHPYAVSAALDLIEDGVSPESLPPDPTGIAEAQWERAIQKTSEAVRLLQAYAILEVPAPDDLVERVGQVGPAVRKSLLADPLLAMLVRREPGGRRIYHSLLADHVSGQMADDETRTCHQRAAEAYRARLRAHEKPDELAALRLPEHVLGSEAAAAFSYVVLNESAEPLLLLGRLSELRELVLRALATGEPNTKTRAALLGTLGNIYSSRGDLDGAEKAYRESLELHTQLDCPDQEAHDWGNLGTVYAMRGDFEKAEAMHSKALEIDRQHGRSEGIVTQYMSLAIVRQQRGDLSGAEQLLSEALRLAEENGLSFRAADVRGNLGRVYLARGSLDKAAEMYQRALDTHRELGDEKGIARDYCSLANVHQDRNDLVKAAKVYEKSLAMAEQMGLLDLVASNYGNMGCIWLKRGQLDKAEEMFEKSLEIDQRLGRQEGMASDYANLGGIYAARGELDKARELWTKSRDLFATIGMPHMVDKVQEWLDQFPDQPEGPPAPPG